MRKQNKHLLPTATQWRELTHAGWLWTLKSVTWVRWSCLLRVNVERSLGELEKNSRPRMICAESERKQGQVCCVRRLDFRCPSSAATPLQEMVVQCGTPGRGQQSSFPLEIRTPQPQAPGIQQAAEEQHFLSCVALSEWRHIADFRWLLRVLDHRSLLPWYLLKWNCLQFFQLLLARGMCHGGEVIGPLYWAGFLHLPPGSQACQARIFTLWLILPALYLEEEIPIQIKLFNRNSIKWHHWYKN